MKILNIVYFDTIIGNINIITTENMLFKGLSVGYTYSGKDFNNKIDKSAILIKLINRSHINRGYRFIENAINSDINPFNLEPTQMPGGIFFSTHDNIANCIMALKDCEKSLITNVTIPDNAMVYVDNYQFKADIMYLGKFVEIEDFYESLDYDNIALESVNRILKFLSLFGMLRPIKKIKNTYTIDHNILDYAIINKRYNIIKYLMSIGITSESAEHTIRLMELKK